MIDVRVKCFSLLRMKVSVVCGQLEGPRRLFLWILAPGTARLSLAAVDRGQWVPTKLDWSVLQHGHARLCWCWDVLGQHQYMSAKFCYSRLIDRMVGKELKYKRPKRCEGIKGTALTLQRKVRMGLQGFAGDSHQGCSECSHKMPKVVLSKLTSMPCQLLIEVPDRSLTSFVFIFSLG